MTSVTRKEELKYSILLLERLLVLLFDLLLLVLSRDAFGFTLPEFGIY